MVEGSEAGRLQQGVVRSCGRFVGPRVSRRVSCRSACKTSLMLLLRTSRLPQLRFHLRFSVIPRANRRGLTGMPTEHPVASSKRVFPPLYVSSGDVAQDRLAFFHVLERLKVCCMATHVLP